MNAKQYAEYQAAIEAFLRVNNIKPGCFGPTDHEAEHAFSWHQCGCCGTRLGGNRSNYIFNTNTGTQFEESICDNCVYYLEYGELDDLTMLEIEESKKADASPFLDRDTFMRSF